MISIIMPSYLGSYPKAAKDREKKLCRAIESVFNQDYKDWELIVVADGCERTVDIVREYANGKIVGLYVDKVKGWPGGILRNVGIRHARGDIICYLDSDDMFGEFHLSIIADEFDKDWVFFNDMVYNKKDDSFKERNCFLKKYKCGTSNIAHRNNGAYWDDVSYYGTDDWHFISKMMRFPYKNIICPEYLVCHIPGRYDV